VNLLLDTHAFLWLLGEPNRLPGGLVAVLEDPVNRVLVSAASVMEVATKVRIGKLPTASHLVDPAVWSSRSRQMGLEPLPITQDHALAAGSLAWDHRDPFDRLLAAQALTGDLVLVSRDSAFGAVPSLRVIWHCPGGGDPALSS
jgi:PIN domain nuclease of toxin-antitoxin system